ncbi:MAG: ABC transporter permease, partial [Haliea sp.]
MPAVSPVPSAQRKPPATYWLVALSFLVLALAGASVFVGASQVSLLTLLSAHPDAMASQVLVVSRIPRTLALILAGMSMAVAGSIMQMLARNRFVEPSTAGTVESASLGLLVIALTAPGLPPFGKMVIASLFALAGTALFLAILRRIPLRSALIVPLVGLVLGGVISAE